MLAPNAIWQITASTADLSSLLMARSIEKMHDSAIDGVALLSSPIQFVISFSTRHSLYRLNALVRTLGAALVTAYRLEFSSQSRFPFQMGVS